MTFTRPLYSLRDCGVCRGTVEFAFQVIAKMLEQVSEKEKHPCGFTKEQHIVSSFSGQNSELKVPLGRNIVNSTEQGKSGYLLSSQMSFIRPVLPVRAQQGWVRALTVYWQSDGQGCGGERVDRGDGIRKNQKDGQGWGREGMWWSRVTLQRLTPEELPRSGSQRALPLSSSLCKLDLGTSERQMVFAYPRLWYLTWRTQVCFLLFCFFTCGIFPPSECSQGWPFKSE